MSARRAAALRCVLAIGVLTSGTSVALAAAPPSEPFTPLGTLGGTLSAAYGVSADGSVVVGVSETSLGTFEAFLWSVETGMIGLGDLGGGYSAAYAASADGTVVAGESIGPSGLRAFVWTPETGMLPLPLLADGFGGAYGVSADGSVIAGYSLNRFGQLEACLWLSDGSVIGSGLPESIANGVSADGLTIVGEQSSDGNRLAFVWTSEGGPSYLAPLTSGGYAVAYTVSADGLTAAGYSRNSQSRAEATVWTSDGETFGLGTLGGVQSFVYSLSADGTRAVGTASGSGMRALLWDAATGPRTVQEELAALGVDLTGWNLEEAQGISASGDVIAGNGTDPSGALVAWVANVRGEKTPEQLVLELREVVKALPGNAPESLKGKLDNVLDSLAAGNEREAANRLNAFANAVRAQRGKKIDAATADELIAAARGVIEVLRSSNL